MGKKIIFGIILILGIFFRLWQLNTLPGGLFLDEINMAVDAKTLAQQGTDQYGRPFPFYFEDATDFKLPGYIYLATASYKVFGNQIITMHIPSALSGIASIFLIFFLARLLFPEKKYIGYFASTTLALSPFAIVFSRISYETNVALAFILLYLIALVHVLKNKNILLWLVIGSISILIANWTYPSPRVVIPLFTLIILFICYIFRLVEVKRRNIFLSLIFLGALCITFIPTILFPFADGRQLNLVSVDLIGHPGISGWILKANSILVSYIRLWNFEFLFDKGDLFAYRHGTKEVGIFLLIFIIPFLLGIFWSLKNVFRKNFSLIFLFLFALIAGLPSALSSETPYGTRVVVMLIPYTIFIAIGCEVFFMWIQKQSYLVRQILYIAIGLILIYQVGLFSYVYFVDYKSTSLPEFPVAPVQIASYIKNFNQQNPSKQIYFLSDESCRTWANDGLYLWYYDNLPNTQMIIWNNTYRTLRYSYKHSSPFEAYEKVKIPSVFIPKYNLYMFTDYAAQDKSPKGSLLIRCGYATDTYDKTKESLVKIFYMNPQTHDDPYYVVTVRK